MPCRRVGQHRHLGMDSTRMILHPPRMLHLGRELIYVLHLTFGRSHNGRFLRHRFSPKPLSVATALSLPKRTRVAKEAVSAALQTSTRQRSERRFKPNDAPTTKPRPYVKTMLAARRAAIRRAFRAHKQRMFEPRFV